ncbi:KGGVGR-motif variant AAA ATPase [Actinokineospora guangxiensis]|uniref:KGGVGR-motif variant AAA ATPase n=1 Tax=Actinokineospora guangxiensis TaxID=1490288 RepID=A0ABW0ETF0_9PSEU
MIVTFYSYKGGVGRSFALANVAIQLARWGNRVLCVDWDLEAPGLHEYFRPWIDEPGIGVVELVTAAADGEVEWRDAVLPAAIDGLGDGCLHLLAAGRMDEGYVDRVQSISWPRMYSEHDLGWRFETLAAELRAEYDFVLIDSRTGITDIGGICTAQLPDVLVLCLTPNQQNLTGAIDVARRARRARVDLPYDKAGLLVLPIVSRFDGREEYERARSWRERITAGCAHLYSNWVPDQVSRVHVVERTTIPYLPYWSFGEELPAITENSSNPEMVTYYLENVAALLCNGLTEADVLVASRDAYVSAARSRAPRSVVDGQADIAVYGRAAQAAELREALASFGVRVAPEQPPSLLAGRVRCAVVVPDSHGRDAALLDQLKAARVPAVTWRPRQEDPKAEAADMVREINGQTGGTLAAAVVRVGEWYLAERRTDDARQVLGQLTALAPGTRGIRALRARIASDEGDLAEVITVLGHGGGLDGQELRLLGRAHLALGDVASGVLALSGALERSSGGAAEELHRELAAVHAELGDYDAAERHLRAVFDLVPTGGDVWAEVAVDLAVLQQRHGRVSAARELLVTVFEASGSPGARVVAGQHLAGLLEQRGDGQAVAVWQSTVLAARAAGDTEAMVEAVRGVVRTAGADRGPLADMVRLVAEAGADARAGRRDVEVAELRELAGVLQVALGRYVEAGDELAGAVAGYRKVRDTAGVARALARWAWVSWEVGEREVARRQVAEVRSLLPVLRGAQADVVRDLVGGVPV